MVSRKKKNEKELKGKRGSDLTQKGKKHKNYQIAKGGIKLKKELKTQMGKTGSKPEE